MGFIDCDTHVLENEDTWSYLAKNELQYKPVKVQMPAAPPGAVKRAPAPPVSIWLMGDTWVTAAPLDGNMRNNANKYLDGVADLTNLGGRIEDMDSLGIDVQLLLSTFYLGAELDNPAAEVALARSYNRWMADHVRPEYRARLPWAVRAPMRSIPEAIKELNFGKENGAAGIQVRGLEHAMYLTDSFFEPLWQHVNDLEMGVFVHLGEATRRIDGQSLGRTIANPASMMRQLFPLMAGFHAVIASDFEKRYPNIRWGFLEGGSSWIPTVLQMDTRLRASADEFLRHRPLSHDALEEKQVFIAVETDDALDHLSAAVGENILVVGTDYGHNDRGTELGAHSVIQAREDVDAGLAKKIVDSSGRRLLGIKEDFTPAPAPSGLGKVPHVQGASTPDGKPILVHKIVSRV
ncbi:amidohydrolase family protein [Nocardioides sp.]|uniref:amidohydrolase family protein n=1 Tax=Nocardioides sp. TaxID=35761 RepID=UPI003D0F4342